MFSVYLIVFGCWLHHFMLVVNLILCSCLVVSFFVFQVCGCTLILETIMYHVGLIFLLTSFWKRMLTKRKRILLIAAVQLEILEIEFIMYQHKAKQRNVRSCDAIDLYRKRHDIGSFANYIPEIIKPKNASIHFNFFRMTRHRFLHLLKMLNKRLEKKKNHKVPITPEERLAITIRLLSTGDSTTSIGHLFNVSPCTVRKIALETAEIIWTTMQPKYLQQLTEERMIEVSKQFYEKWKYPNCIGAVDGKHIDHKCPYNANTQHFNYKKTHSTVLMALAGPNCEFLEVDIGGYGGNHDSRLFSSSKFGRLLIQGKANLPDPASLPGTDMLCPYHIIGDEAFTMTNYMMRPYPGRNTKVLPYDEAVFNYRLSRARRTSENAFGIWSSVWRMFRRPLEYQPKNIVTLAKASIVLHNYLMAEEGSAYQRQLIAAEQFENWTIDKRGVKKFGSNMYTKDAAEMRNVLKQYFVSPEGKFDHQETAILNS